MRTLLFCNIGWMGKYAGNIGKPDKIVGGGSFVDKNRTGAEVCNFRVADDGFVYGHVETYQGKKDRKIRIENLGGGKASSISGVDVVWTARDPEQGGRRVVGWYRDATVFRERQEFIHPASRQHVRDKLTTYRVRAKADNVHLLTPEDRHLRLGRGPGWIGQVAWWMPKTNSAPEIAAFLRRVKSLIAGTENVATTNRASSSRGHGSAAAPSTPYMRYAEAYEAEVHPRHDQLQRSFEKFLTKGPAADLLGNHANVDLRYRNAARQLVLVEIKPCDAPNIRYAIRTAMGQLLDYRQKCSEPARLLIVTERRPSATDRALALCNAFGIAFPEKDGFRIIWPKSALA